MRNTGERGEREITGGVNAKEVEIIQKSKKLASKTKQLSRAWTRRTDCEALMHSKERPVMGGQTP